MSKYTPIIGLEVHVETTTVSKMFSADNASYFGKKPNIHTSPTSLGLPGSLPYINEKAIDSCIKIGLALGCTVSELSVFERKNYFYPDLPKGYQISQYRWPLCKRGVIVISDSEGRKREIRINRVHQEEDTGKLFHAEGQTLVDFNRAGVPLVEIVTEPDFRDTAEIRDYAKKLQRILRYLGVSDADMEKGQMRLEANVSLRAEENASGELPNYRVELKNINSFRFMIAAVEYEIERQSRVLDAGEILAQETRGWDQQKKVTYVQRSKEEANDYRYFPDPDLLPFRIQETRIQRIRKELPELPDEKARRFVQDYGLTEYQAEILTETCAFADYFEEAVKVGKKHGVDAGRIANTLINKKFDRVKISPAKLIEMLREAAEQPVASREEIEKAVDFSIEQNPQAVADYKKGKGNAIQFLLGGVIRATKGQAEVKEIFKILKEKLKDEVK